MPAVGAALLRPYAAGEENEKETRPGAKAFRFWMQGSFTRPPGLAWTPEGAASAGNPFAHAAEGATGRP